MTFRVCAPVQTKASLRSYRVMNEAILPGRTVHRPAATSSVLLAVLVMLTACGGGKGDGYSSTDNSATVSGNAPSSASDSAPEPELETAVAPTPVPLPTPTEAPVSALPPAQQLPSDVNVSQPGVAVKPVDAKSSATENDANSAAKAIDGDATTRWSSAKDDG